MKIEPFFVCKAGICIVTEMGYEDQTLFEREIKFESEKIYDLDSALKEAKLVEEYANIRGWNFTHLEYTDKNGDKTQIVLVCKSTRFIERELKNTTVSNKLPSSTET